MEVVINHTLVLNSDKSRDCAGYVILTSLGVLSPKLVKGKGNRKQKDTI